MYTTVRFGKLLCYFPSCSLGFAQSNVSAISHNTYTIPDFVMWIVLSCFLSVFHVFHCSRVLCDTAVLFLFVFMTAITDIIRVYLALLRVFLNHILTIMPLQKMFVKNLTLNWFKYQQFELLGTVCHIFG